MVMMLVSPAGDRGSDPTRDINVLMCVQGAAANPDSEEQQQRLREAAEGLRMATNAAAQNAIKKRLVNKLEVRTQSDILLLILLDLNQCFSRRYKDWVGWAPLLTLLHPSA